MRRHGKLHLVVILPDGSRSTIPADWTDADLKATKEANHGTLASVSDLMHARTIVDGLLRRQMDPGQEVTRATDLGVSGSMETTGGSVGGTRQRRTKVVRRQTGTADRKNNPPRRKRGAGGKR